MNYLIIGFVTLVMILMGVLYFVNQSVAPPTPQACIKAGGQFTMEPGNKFKCKMPKEWWRF